MRLRRYRKPSGPYLEARTQLRTRFAEVDSLNIVWHGHYLTYFEDAREAFGHQYDISYRDIMQAGFIAPMVHIQCDYLLPLRYDESFFAIARLFKRESAKLEFYYELRRADDERLLTSGLSIQALADKNGTLLLTLPDFMRDFYSKWEERFVTSGT